MRSTSHPRISRPAVREQDLVPRGAAVAGAPVALVPTAHVVDSAAQQPAPNMAASPTRPGSLSAMPPLDTPAATCPARSTATAPTVSQNVASPAASAASAGGGASRLRIRSWCRLCWLAVRSAVAKSAPLGAARLVGCDSQHCTSGVRPRRLLRWAASHGPVTSVAGSTTAKPCASAQAQAPWPQSMLSTCARPRLPVPTRQ